MASEQAAAVIKMLKERPVAPAGATIEDMRKGLDAGFGAGTLAADIRCEKVDVDGVPAEWVSAGNSSASRAVLYLHGGGYVLGSIQSHRELCSRVARAAAARVLLIDYRLGPENPFPAAVEDAVKAYRWLVKQVPASSIAVAGDSAGGGLTAATLISLRDQGVALPAAGVMLSPWTDLAGTGDSMKSRASLDPMVSGNAVGPMAAAYLGGADAKNPLASPLYADLHGLPPLLIQVGTSETLFDDSTRFDARARSAGVDVTFEAWNEMVHVFQAFAGMLPEGQEAIDHIGAFIQSRTRELARA